MIPFKNRELPVAKSPTETIITFCEIKLESLAAFGLLSSDIAACWLQWHKCHQKCLARYIPVARVAPSQPATG
jgi:hypothetical protein